MKQPTHKLLVGKLDGFDGVYVGIRTTFDGHEDDTPLACGTSKQEAMYRAIKILSDAATDLMNAVQK